MQNPLLSLFSFPPFSHILPQHIEPAVKQLIKENDNKMRDLLRENLSFTWNNLMSQIEEMNDRLTKAWSPVSHMHAVVETECLRAAYKASLPLLTEYHTKFMQNEAVFSAVRSIAESKEYVNLDPAQRKVIDNELRDFKLAGVHLMPSDKAQLTDLQKQLSQMTTQFAEHVMDATQGWILHLTDAKNLLGLPEDAKEMAAQDAKTRGKTGWVFTLEYPSYSAFIKYADNRELRRLMYEAYVTRASDQGPNAFKWDNTQLMNDILKARYRMARLLGFDNFAQYSLATKMAAKPERVMSFLYDLIQRSKRFAEQDIQQLRDIAKDVDGLTSIESWDVPYYSEKCRQLKYHLSQEELRPYFPVHKVLNGLFQVTKKLYGVEIKECTGVDVWHKDVLFFEIHDENGQLRGYFYIDLYARPHKREGAWMDECRVRRRLSDGSIQQPIAFLTCNFNRPLGDKPALLTHDEVLTLFHEFGHCLHHLLTTVDYAGVSGLNGVLWDAVEFPSQFFECWCWDKEALRLISSHYETGEPLPDSLYHKLILVKTFQSGMQMLRQLEFALFDFRIHLEYDEEKGARIQEILEEVRQAVSVIKTPLFNRFQNTFLHIFAGSYAAGYYSYKWAEVLSSDAFSKFEETGVFDRATGRAFLHHILEQGGTRDPMDLFIAFRGREPQIDALLRHSGLVMTERTI